MNPSLAGGGEAEETAPTEASESEEPFKGFNEYLNVYQKKAKHEELDPEEDKKYAEMMRKKLLPILGEYNRMASFKQAPAIMDEEKIEKWKAVFDKVFETEFESLKDEDKKLNYFSKILAEKNKEANANEANDEHPEVNKSQEMWASFLKKIKLEKQKIFRQEIEAKKRAAQKKRKTS
jgi:hypothetical protein